MRALVVGLGRMGGFHRRVLMDLGYDVATVDPDPAKNSDYQDLSAAGRSYDVAAIACPIEHLADTAERLVGVPMLVEKPFAGSHQEAVALAETLKDTPVCVGFVQRFNPQIRALRGRMPKDDAASARFVRWSDRPSPDPLIDLRIHDIDLAYYLGVSDVAEYDTRTEQIEKVVRVEIDYGKQGALVADLTVHVQSPLHAMWFAFLTGRDHPKPADALRALEAVTL